MNMSKKLFPLLFLIITAIAVACGGSNDISIADSTPDQAEEVDVSTAAAESGDQQEAEVSTMAAESSVEEEEDVYRGEFRRTWSDPPTLDPHLTSDTTSSVIVVEVFSGLVSLNTDLQLELEIAEEMTLDDTGTIYTFRLRPDARFHDGTPITANDFKWSIERAANPDTGSTVAETYLNDIVGSQDVFEGKTTDMAGVQVIDDKTLQITIDAPKAYFLAS